MSFSNTYETIVLNWVFNASSVTRPTAWYVGLFTSDPGEGQGGTEVSGNGYVRKSATFTVSGNTGTTSNIIEYPAATGSWGTITHIAVYDAATSGTQIAYAALTTSKTIDTADVLRIPAGDIDITLD
tara:strand:+ start:387 stop:767 length:381 start_codon:yes stop_codon:yes gene_type:complete